MFEEKIMQIVSNICNMPTLDCRGLSKKSEAKKIFEILNINPDSISIYEIPCDWNNQVAICFEYENGFYELDAGLGWEDNKFFIEFLELDDENMVIDYDHQIPIEFFSN